jgi:hypothetical protein
MKKHMLILILFVCIKQVNAQIITTFAGNGTDTTTGDGGQATAAGFTNIPGSLAFDASGNFFVCDNLNRIRKINMGTGVINTVAGIGITGYTGDGGQVTAAKIDVGGMASDKMGNLYFADGTANVIRKIDVNGIITTIAGNGTMGYSGDGGAATAAQLVQPWNITIDTIGNIYVSDGVVWVVRKIDTTGIITTIAGDTSATSSYFSGDGGPATAAHLNTPNYLSVDKAGNLYVYDSGNNRIRKVNSAGIISTFAGNGTLGYSADGGMATAANLNYIWGIATDLLGNVYFSEMDSAGNNARIRKINSAGVLTTAAGISGVQGYTGDGGYATLAQLTGPSIVAVDMYNNFYFVDGGKRTIRKVTYCSSPITVGVSGATTICSADSTTLTATGATTYTWNTNAGAVTTPSITIGSNGYTAYSLTGIAGGCIAQDSITISVIPSPTVYFSLYQDSMPHIWDVYPTYPPSMTSVVWNWGDGTSSTSSYSSHTYSVAGLYNICVTVTDSNGCMATYCQNDSVYRYANNSTSSNIIQVNVINNTTGINQLTNTANRLTIYPNPAQNNFTIETKTSDKQTLQVFDVNGKLVLTQTISGTTNVDASTLSQGVYNVSVTSNEGVVNKRLVIVK